MRKNLYYIFLFATFLFTVSCGGGNDDATPSVSEIVLRNQTVSYSSTGQFLTVTTKGSWTLSVSYHSGTADWCTLSKTSGNNNDATVYVSYSANTGSTSREATLTLTSGSVVKTATLVQQSKGDATNPKAYNWLELPFCVETSTQKFLVHSAAISGTMVRNYTALYDTENHIPIWVAYPMHKNWYSGSSGRTDAWALDPMLAASYQANLGTAESGMGNGYDRGHMIPSASRLANTNINAQTFYYTNMTPQENGFNAKKWAEMESMVRTWAGSGQDTLYVVTGAVLKTVGGNETVKYVYSRHDSGKKIAVPNYYYKVLLKRSASGTYKSIGFWFEHKAASGSPTKSDARTVDWIEEKTGLDFFANLPVSTQTTVEKSYTVSDWSGLK